MIWVFHINFIGIGCPVSFMVVLRTDRHKDKKTK